MNGTLPTEGEWCRSLAGKCPSSIQPVPSKNIKPPEIAGLFDIDHMAQVEVRGPEAEAFVNWVVTYDVRKMKAFDAH